MYRTGLRLCKAKASWQCSAAIFLPTRMIRAFRTCEAQNQKRPMSPLDSLPIASVEGSLARTDYRLIVEHPQEDDLPTNSPVQGRGGSNHKRTLASFSLEGKVGVVTGGARGLGSMMSQALILSGADLTIVDLQHTYDCKHPLEFCALTKNRAGSRTSSRAASRDIQARESRRNTVSKGNT
jgi:D-arabinitol 2-dehydrogenase